METRRGAEGRERKERLLGAEGPAVVFLVSVPNAKGSRGTLVPDQIVKHKLKGRPEKMDRYFN